MKAVNLARVLNDLDNNAAYLRSTLRAAKPGMTVPVPRGYLQKVIRNLNKLGRYTRIQDEPSSGAVPPAERPED